MFHGSRKYYGSPLTFNPQSLSLFKEFFFFALFGFRIWEDGLFGYTHRFLNIGQYVLVFRPSYTATPWYTVIIQNLHLYRLIPDTYRFEFDFLTGAGGGVEIFFLKNL